MNMPRRASPETLDPLASVAAVAALEPGALQESLDREGYAITAPMVDSDTCAALARLYTASEGAFRSTVTMARHGFGSGEYKYFARPLPDLVQALRRSLYARLAPIANAWEARLGGAADWPADHESVAARCAWSSVRAANRGPSFCRSSKACLPSFRSGSVPFKGFAARRGSKSATVSR